MAARRTSFSESAGYLLFPRSPADLTSTTACPACFTALTSTTCSRCGLDLAHPAAVELAAASTSAATALDRRVELIGQIRAETGAAPSSAAAPALVAPVAAQVAAPPAAPDAAPRRHLGVQVILLIVGVSLLAVGAIFFLVYAFITFGLLWRSVIIAAVTIAAFAGATVLKRRKLSATAEAIAGLAVVFSYLDAFAIRANDFFGSAAADGATYWGGCLLVAAAVFALWHSLTGLRLPNLIAFATAGPGLALLVGGLSAPLDDSVRWFIAFAALGASGMLHPLAARARTEVWLLVSASTLGLVGATLTALIVTVDVRWAPAVTLPAVVIIAAALVASLTAAATARAAMLVIAGIGGIAASLVGIALEVRASDFSVIVLSGPLGAVAVALALEWLARRTATARLPLAVGAGAAGVVGGVALLILPVLTALTPVVSLVAHGTARWSVPGGEPIPLNQDLAAALLELALVTVLVAAAWLLPRAVRARDSAPTASTLKTSAARQSTVLGLAVATLTLLPPLTGQLWLAVIGWLALAAVGVVVLVIARRAEWTAAVRIPIAVGSAAALLLGWASSWASIDTWWFGSVGAVALLVVARLAIERAGARATLLAVATALSVLAIGSEGWHINERFHGGATAGVDAVHVIAALAVVLLITGALLARRLSQPEVRVLFWMSGTALASAATASWVALVVGFDRTTTVLPEFGTSVILGILTLAALVTWMLLPRTAGFRVERASAAVALAPALAWLVDSTARAIDVTALARTITVVIALSALHVVALVVARGALSRLAGWTAIGLAAVIGSVAVAVGTVDPLEWVTVAIGAALLGSGAATMARSTTASSWGRVAPGLAVILVPSLLATFGDPPVWRLVALGAACVAAIVVGSLGRLQAPLILGSVVVLIHAVRTFAPQLLTIYQLTEWWVWAVIGGAILLFLGLTIEKRVRGLRAVGRRLAELR